MSKLEALHAARQTRPEIGPIKGFEPKRRTTSKADIVVKNGGAITLGEFSVVSTNKNGLGVQSEPTALLHCPKGPSEVGCGMAKGATLDTLAVTSSLATADKVPAAGNTHATYGGYPPRCC